MRFSSTSSLLLLAGAATAFPFMGEYHNMNEQQKRELTERVQASVPPELSKRTAHLARRGAEAYTSQYPYSGAKIDGLPGSQKGGYQVPAPGDTAHYYQDPPAGAYRGPCPGLNAAANHGFLSRDGITTFNELVAAQQNVYGTSWDLAVTLATLGVGLDGDLITTRLSLGGDATSKTSNGIISSKEGGLNTHLKFEADTSLTRNDYYTANGDNFSFNGTLFGYMTTTCNKNYNRECLSKYRKMRYDQSLAENGQFFFGPLSLLLFGAASFLYELMPTNGGGPDFATISTFFGAVDNGDGTYSHVPERIPDNWFVRATPYSGTDVVTEILAMYLENPVAFGASSGQGNFLGLNYGSQIVNGQLNPQTTVQDLTCLLQNVVLGFVPSTVQDPVLAPIANLLWIAGKLNPIFQSLGCPIKTPGTGQVTRSLFSKDA